MCVCYITYIYIYIYFNGYIYIIYIYIWLVTLWHPVTKWLYHSNPARSSWYVVIFEWSQPLFLGEGCPFTSFTRFSHWPFFNGRDSCAPEKIWHWVVIWIEGCPAGVLGCRGQEMLTYADKSRPWLGGERRQLKRGLRHRDARKKTPIMSVDFAVDS